MAKLPEGIARLYKQTLVTRLKKMAAFASPSIKPVRERRLQPLHSGHQISIWRFKGEVKMVSHYYERMKQPVAPAARLEKTVLKCLFRTIALKYPTAIISAVDDVVRGTRKFKAELARHDREYRQPLSSREHAYHEIMVGDDPQRSKVIRKISPSST
jgi:hypothetical protein